MGVGRDDNKLEGCPRVVQILVFLFNFLFFVFGVTMIGYGAYVLVETKEYKEISEVDYLASAQLMIGVGVIVTIIAFVGCCGACLLNKCLLMTFFVLMLIIFICEIAVVAVGYAFKDKVLNQLDKDMDKAFFKKYGSGDTALDKGIDTMQKELKCCGVTNYTQWKDSMWLQNMTDQSYRFPDSCCKKIEKDCGKKQNVDHWTEGCFDKFQDLLKTSLPVIGGIAIGILIIQILAMIFACVLFVQAKKAAKGTFA